jgi:hypothetical protein
MCQVSFSLWCAVQAYNSLALPNLYLRFFIWRRAKGFRNLAQYCAILHKYAVKERLKDCVLRAVMQLVENSGPTFCNFVFWSGDLYEGCCFWSTARRLVGLCMMDCEMSWLSVVSNEKPYSTEENCCSSVRWSVCYLMMISVAEIV